MSYKLRRLENMVKQRLENGEKELSTKLLNDISYKCFPFTMAMDFSVDEVREVQGRILTANIPPNLLIRARNELYELGLKPDTIESLRRLLLTSEEYERYFSSGKYTDEYDEAKLKAEKAMTHTERVDEIQKYINQLKNKERIKNGL